MVTLRTQRLVLRPWAASDAEAFAQLNADPEVMADLGGPLSRSDSDAKLRRFSDAFDSHGIGRLVIEDEDGFQGYVGIMPSDHEHPLGFHHDIGWRLMRRAWGRGYATEGARAALDDGFHRAGLRKVFAYTSADNIRSEAVMERLRLRRDPVLDFDLRKGGEVVWHGRVWAAERV